MEKKIFFIVRIGGNFPTISAEAVKTRLTNAGYTVNAAQEDRFTAQNATGIFVSVDAKKDGEEVGDVVKEAFVGHDIDISPDAIIPLGSAPKAGMVDDYAKHLA